MAKRKPKSAPADVYDGPSYDEQQRAKGGYSTHVLGPNLPQGQAGFPRGNEYPSRDKLQSGDRNKAFIKRGV